MDLLPLTIFSFIRRKKIESQDTALKENLGQNVYKAAL